MKNLYIVIISLAFFSQAKGQRIASGTYDFTNHTDYSSSITLRDYNILWVFNDVGNVNTNRNGTTTDAISETESSVVETSVYPIPANDHLNFSFRTEITSGSILIFDASGKLILNQKFSGTETTVSSSNFIPGIYLYQVLNESKSVNSGQFIKN